MKENLGIKGKVEYELRDSSGNLKDSGVIPNTITELFDAHIADQLSDQTEAAIGYMALGSGVGQTAASTDLSNYLASSMIALSGTVQGSAAADNDVVYSAYWGAGVVTDSITEAGIFRTSGTTRDTLMTYNSGLSISKGASDTLKIDWTVTLGAS